MKRALILLAIVGAGQLAIPAYMIHRQEVTLREGRPFKFRTRPVDPYDAFRGRYVALAFEQDHAPGNFRPQQPAFARIEEGSDGFAVVREIVMNQPASGDFMKVEIRNQGWGADSGSVYFAMPFDRYYLEERKAPEAERLYRENNRRGASESATYAIVRVRRGCAALENFYIAGKPIAEIVRGTQP